MIEVGPLRKIADVGGSFVNMDILVCKRGDFVERFPDDAAESF